MCQKCNNQHWGIGVTLTPRFRCNTWVFQIKLLPEALHNARHGASQRSGQICQKYKCVYGDLKQQCSSSQAYQINKCCSVAGLSHPTVSLQRIQGHSCKQWLLSLSVFRQKSEFLHFCPSLGTFLCGSMAAHALWWNVWVSSTSIHDQGLVLETDR